LDTLLFSDSSKLPMKQKEKIILGVAKGLHHLHKEGIIHRDLAARNVLLDKSNTPKISDFGMSRLLGTDETNYAKTKSSIGPIRWMAPENMKKKYSPKSDVWSFASFLFEVFHETEPWAEVGDDMLNLAVRIRDKGVTPAVNEDLTPKKYMAVMEKCWQIDPDERPSMEDVCNSLTV